MEQINSTPKPLAVETTALTKRYRSKAAVYHLDMKVPTGAIYGFIGRNGAGKSTTLKMLCGLAAQALSAHLDPRVAAGGEEDRLDG